MVRLIAAALGAALMMLAAPAQAQFGAESSASKAGFSFPKDGPVKILVFRPDVQVGEQTTGGMNEPNADWTAAARNHMSLALEKAQAARSNELVVMPELEGE